jgi:predicted transposase YdaD
MAEIARDSWEYGKQNGEQKGRIKGRHRGKQRRKQGEGHYVSARALATFL